MRRANRLTRRALLRTGAASGIAALAGCQSLTATDTHAEQAEEPGSTTRTRTTETAETGPEGFTPDPPTAPYGDDTGDEPVAVRGALYLPARAFNVYQMWADYDPDVIERDLGYAADLNLNAIRTWLSYEQWKRDDAALEEAFDHFLSAADDEDIEVLVGVFEGIGEEPTENHLTDTNPWTAKAVLSPATRVVERRKRWGRPRRYVRWFMDRYRDDDRLLAIENMNEPGWNVHRKRFTRSMHHTLVEERGEAPLSMGSTSMANNADYLDWGLDVLQFHYNFPISRDIYRSALGEVDMLADRLPQPVWLTEWQRTRSGRGFHTAPAPDERTPDYDSLAPVIQDAGVGNFFWSLMVKPGYFRTQRKHGILNGLFHEDGAVYSREDAIAIKAMSGDPSLDVEERQAWPDWAASVKQKAGLE